MPTTTRLWQDEYFTADRPGQESDLFQSNNQQTTLDVLAQVVQHDMQHVDSMMTEITENEQQKRRFKPTILIIVSFVAALQMISMNFIVFLVIFSALVHAEHGFLFIHRISPGELDTISEFLKYYIGATVLELLGMIGFIIRYVFNESMRDIFKDTFKRNRYKKNASQSKPT